MHCRTYRSRVRSYPFAAGAICGFEDKPLPLLHPLVHWPFAQQHSARDNGMIEPDEISLVGHPNICARVRRQDNFVRQGAGANVCVLLLPHSEVRHSVVKELDGHLRPFHKMIQGLILVEKELLWRQDKCSHAIRLKETRHSQHLFVKPLRRHTIINNSDGAECVSRNINFLLCDFKFFPHCPNKLQFDELAIRFQLLEGEYRRQSTCSQRKERPCLICLNIHIYR